MPRPDLTPNEAATTPGVDAVAQRFDYQSPTPQQSAQLELFRAEFKGLAVLIHTSCYPSREAALALTKLEEAAMWANKALIHG